MRFILWFNFININYYYYYKLRQTSFFWSSNFECRLLSRRDSRRVGLTNHRKHWWSHNKIKLRGQSTHKAYKSVLRWKLQKWIKWKFRNSVIILGFLPIKVKWQCVKWMKILENGRNQNQYALIFSLALLNCLYNTLQLNF